MSEIIDIDKIGKSPRYIYTTEFIFPTKYKTTEVFVKTNDKTQFHVQEFHEICVISRGEGYHAIENTVVKAKKGDIFIIPPGIRHAILGGEGFDVHYIHLHPEFVASYSSRMKELPAYHALFEIEPLMRASGNTYRHLYLEGRVFNDVISLMNSLVGMWQTDAASKLILESYVMIVLTIFCREYEKMQTQVGKNANTDKHFMNSISHIIDHFNEKITIDDLAALAGLARTTYIKRFREVTGKSPKQFITKKRIDAARELLLKSDKSISKIAEETGFYDAAHFTKAFYTATGIPPSKYKEQLEKN